MRADEAVEGARSPARLVPVLGEPVARSLLDEEADAALGCGGRVVERVLDFGEAQVDDFGDGFGRERVEDDLLVEAVQLRVNSRQCGLEREVPRRLTSSGGYMLCTRARTRSFALSVTVPSGSVEPSSARMSDPMLLVKMMVAMAVHGQHPGTLAMNVVKLTVLEVDGAALRVRKLAFVEHLQEDVGDIRVRLFELVCMAETSAACSGGEKEEADAPSRSTL